MIDPEDTKIKAEIDKITHDIDTIIKNITTVVPLTDAIDPSETNSTKENEPNPKKPDPEQC